MKSISSLFAGAILVAITISTAYIAASVLSYFTQAQTKSVEQSPTVCVSASFQIANAYCTFSKPSVLNSTKILLHLDNSLKDEENLDNNLTVYGSILYKQGKSGSGLYFDGSTYGEIQNTVDFNPNEITIELWVKPSD